MQKSVKGQDSPRTRHQQRGTPGRNCLEGYRCTEKHLSLSIKIKHSKNNFQPTMLEEHLFSRWRMISLYHCHMNRQATSSQTCREKYKSGSIINDNGYTLPFGPLVLLVYVSF